MTPSFKEKAEEITGFGTYGEYLPNVLVERVAEALSKERENTLRLDEVKDLVDSLSKLQVFCEMHWGKCQDYSYKAIENFNNLLGGKS